MTATITAPQTVTARPTKLRNGTWGATVTTPRVGLSVGDTITITTKAGKSWDATIDRIVWKKIESDRNVYIVATRSMPRPANPDHCRSCKGRGHYDGCDRCGADSQ